MAINFDRIPTENPFTLPEPGIYRARIAEAKMTPSKTPGKPPYIAVKYELLDKFGKKLSTVYDNIVESDHPAVLYKTGRLILALGLNLTGDVELKDLCKIIVGKELCMEITHEADNRNPDDRTKDRAKPKLFGSEVFWPIKDAARLIGDVELQSTDDEALPFDVGDEPTAMPDAEPTLMDIADEDY